MIGIESVPVYARNSLDKVVYNLPVSSLVQILIQDFSSRKDREICNLIPQFLNRLVLFLTYRSLGLLEQLLCFGLSPAANVRGYSFCGLSLIHI